MRKALIVGIDFYRDIAPLNGCANDARAVASLLERHGNSERSVNFSVKLLTASGKSDAISRADLKRALRELFEEDGEIVLFYFAGHGYAELTTGYICTSESTSGDDGVSLVEIVTMAKQCGARHKVLVFDSCHSGLAGIKPTRDTSAELSEGMTILTASTAKQSAVESNGSGVFTTLLVNALSGAAANLVGDITPGAVYAHIDQSLGPWSQRPVFKTNVKSFVSLRRVEPALSMPDLRRITEFFPRSGYEHRLDPTYEPERSPGGDDSAIPPPDPQNTARFAILQKFNRVNLVVPVGAPHMWHAAMQWKSCRLTMLGEYYRDLVAQGRI